MSRYPSSYRRTFYYHKPVSVYMAEKHIAEAQKLQEELGSSVQDVKEYLYSLSNSELELILVEYEKLILSEEKEKKSGGARSAKAYAKKTLEKWKSGETEMSGLVAQRFFKILPNFMPLNIKYELVDKLFDHLEELASDNTLKVFYIGPDFNVNQLISEIRVYYEKNLKNYEMPDSLKARFNWLSQSDVVIQKQLVNYFKDKKKSIELEELKSTLIMLSNKLQDFNGKYITGLEHSITISKNTVKIIFHKKARGIMYEKPKSFWESIFG
jgi:hypothetical protein